MRRKQRIDITDLIEKKMAALRKRPRSPKPPKTAKRADLLTKNEDLLVELNRLSFRHDPAMWSGFHDSEVAPRAGFVSIWDSPRNSYFVVVGPQDDTTGEATAEMVLRLAMYLRGFIGLPIWVQNMVRVSETHMFGVDNSQLMANCFHSPETPFSVAPVQYPDLDVQKEVEDMIDVLLYQIEVG